MILSAVNICYDLLHQPFAADGVTDIQNLNSERPALKLIRAVLRDSEIDPEDAVNYSLHRCYCSFKIKIEEDDEDETFDPESTLDELEIKDGDSVFIRRIDDGEEEKVDEMEDKQGSTIRRSSRKRKETDYNEDDDNDPSKSAVISPATSRKRRFSSVPSESSAAVDKVSSNLENLTTNAASAARSISKLLGGDGWKSQFVGKLGSIQTKSEHNLRALWRLVKTSLEISQLSKSERHGLFSSDLVEALTRAYDLRINSGSRKKSDTHFWELGLSDYEQANELLKGKIKQDGSWERSGISRLDKSSLWNPASRFPLSDSGLSGKPLDAARAICVLWSNDKWVNQAPLPGLSPISFRRTDQSALLRQIAELTRVKPGESIPDGLPPIVIEALRESIESNKEAFESNSGSSQGGWAQTRCITDALALLKKRVATTSSIPSPVTGQLSGASGRAGKRSVRPRLDGGK